MANNFYPATGLIGGAEGALDNIDGAGLADGDGAVVITDGIAYLYHLNATSGVAEHSPTIIAPDDNAGDKRWELQNVICTGLDVSNGVIALSIGADAEASTKTDETNKKARIGVPHYLAAEEPVTLILFSNTETTNKMYFGGGTNVMNAATQISFLTAANNTTVTGTSRMAILSDGGIYMFSLKSGANQGAAGAAANELWIDTADQTIKLGTA